MIGFILFQTVFVFSQSVPVTLQGVVSDDKSDLAGVSILVTKSGKNFTSIMTDAGGNFAFQLPLDGDYMVSVTKDGYVTKKFTVNTQGVPAEKATQEFPIISVELGLSKKLEGVDYSLLSQPLNKYSYNAKIDNFEYDKNYLKQMKLGLESIAKAEEVIKTKEKETESSYSSAVKSADKAFANKEWNVAIGKYQEAAIIKPKESYPNSQITLINKTVADALAKEKADAAAKAKAEADRLKKEAEEKLKALLQQEKNLQDKLKKTDAQTIEKPEKDW